ncbi:hypothetical protein CLAFUW4_04053 [Fulvia fulva]|nr:hypothetical protein CLAFUR4_04039 [Fulvia fulva]WPV14058.1 hypothetical protein CLAFUW4_04053 [Fulvia fulva]WPV28791.1 hypothetical protein CLAFUW7_04042 [Fulvia fulva]
MPYYKFQVAKNVLTDADKDRILCIYLSSDPLAINRSKAIRDFGAPSVEAFRKAISRMLKRLDDAGGKDGAMGKPMPKPKNSKKRRKSQPEDDSDEVEYTPTKRGRKAAIKIEDQKYDSAGEEDHINCECDSL